MGSKVNEDNKARVIVIDARRDPTHGPVAGMSQRGQMLTGSMRRQTANCGSLPIAGCRRHQTLRKRAMSRNAGTTPTL